MNYPSAMYIQMIKESLQLWKEIEGKSGTKLYWYGTLKMYIGSRGHHSRRQLDRFFRT